MRINYLLYQNNNRESNAYGKYYARVAHEEMIELEELAEHMSGHNSVFSKGTIQGLLTDMVGCIKELVLDGKKVKLDDLAIFSAGIVPNGGADSEEAFSVQDNVKGIRLRCRATGSLSNKKLNASDFHLQKATKVKATSSASNAGGGSTVVEQP